MPTPDYLVCIECESPCYVFEWEDGTITEAICETCGNDELEQFATPDDFESMAEAWRPTGRPPKI
jgi:hypothetical protein